MTVLPVIRVTDWGGDLETTREVNVIDGFVSPEERDIALARLATFGELRGWFDFEPAEMGAGTVVDTVCAWSHLAAVSGAQFGDTFYSQGPRPVAGPPGVDSERSVPSPGSSAPIVIVMDGGRVTSVVSAAGGQAFLVVNFDGDAVADADPDDVFAAPRDDAAVAPAVVEGGVVGPAPTPLARFAERMAADDRRG